MAPANLNTMSRNDTWQRKTPSQEMTLANLTTMPGNGTWQKNTT
jgi:hypothetical protein